MTQHPTFLKKRSQRKGSLRTATISTYLGVKQLLLQFVLPVSAIQVPAKVTTHLSLNPTTTTVAMKAAGALPTKQ